jgi:hypothetical protein
MTTAVQLIEFLQKLPPDTEIDVVTELHRGYESYTRWESLVLPKEIDGQTDTCNFISGKPGYSCLELGSQ